MKTIIFEKNQVPNSTSYIAQIILNRPDTSNAFDAQMIIEITEVLKKVYEDSSIRVLVLRSSGKNFCAGADLSWMQKSAQLPYDENVEEAKKLGDMFYLLANLSIPTLAVVKGLVFGGGVGLLSCCDIVICEENTKFCLSEVKLGLLPAVILPYLGRKVSRTHLRFMSMSAKIIDTSKALQFGLVNEVASAAEFDKKTLELLNDLLKGAPEAQRSLKNLLSELYPLNQALLAQTYELIASHRCGGEGQHGLSCFFSKESPRWICEASSLSN